MKIIIEGCDGTGKTTLAKKLIERYNIKSYVHINKDDPNDFMFYLQTLRKTSVLFDRHFIGEMIYPNVFGRDGNLNNYGFKQILKAVKLNNVKIIVLYTDKETLLKRLKPDEYTEVANKLCEINQSFIDIAKGHNLYLVDTSKVSFEEICKELEYED